jgi:hypothetical protein
MLLLHEANLHKLSANFCWPINVWEELISTLHIKGIKYDLIHHTVKSPHQTQINAMAILKKTRLFYFI